MRVTRVVAAMVAVGMAVLTGCGPSALKSGDLLELTEEIRVQGESVWDDGTTEAFTTDAPAGTVFKVLYAERATVDIIEVTPVKFRGSEDAEDIITGFLPPALRTRRDAGYGFKDFSMTLKLSDVGTKVRKIEVE